MTYIYIIMFFVWGITSFLFGISAYRKGLIDGVNLGRDKEIKIQPNIIKTAVNDVVNHKGNAKNKEVEEEYQKNLSALMGFNVGFKEGEK